MSVPQEPGALLRCEVAVIGGGLTGATLALALKAAGVHVVLVDAADPRRTGEDADDRASALSPAAVRQWRTLGVWSALEGSAEPIRAIAVTDAAAPGAAARDGASASLAFAGEDLGDTDQDGEPALGWMVENRALRAALAQALIAAEVEVRASTQLRSLLAGPAGVPLADGEMEAALVVGAEGRGSAVRQAAGIGVWGWPYPQAGLVATVALAAPHDGVAHEIFLPGGPLAVLPLPGQRASLVWTETRPRAEALAAAPAAEFEAHLDQRLRAARRSATLAPARLIGARTTFPLALQVAERMVAARVALVGDAAHAVHPLAGQGLNLGLKDVAALAEVVVDARRLGEDVGAPLVLQRYARWRRFDRAGAIAATDGFQRLFAADAPGLRPVRRLGMALAGATARGRRFFTREAAGLLGDAPRLLKGEAL